MTRTIDADALIKTLNEKNIPVDVRVNYEIMNAPTIEPDSDTISRQAAVECVGWGDSVTAVISRIKLLPNVQPDRQRGEWIYRENVFGVAYCSNCGYELHTNDTPFCPSCGADMRGGEEE